MIEDGLLMLSSASKRTLMLGRKVWALLGAAFLFLIVVSILNNGGTPSILHFASQTSATPHAAYLHLLIPASQKDINLCKTLLTAAITGFPTPILINWAQDFHDPSLVAGGSHLAKISGVLDYLRTLPPERDEDLVLIVDGYDIWFQLRPGVLIERYHTINQQANARIQKEMGAAAKREVIKQTIIVSAQKRCWPWSIDDPPCYAVPESSLPPEVYGPQTDTDIGFEKNPYVKFRQRYLNSGDMMGPVGDMKRMFERAVVEMEKDRNFGSDQKIFSQMFGAQEVQREYMRLRHRSWVQKLWEHFFGGKESFLDSDVPNRHVSDAKAGKEDEFGIGLDYASLLGHPTVFAEEDSDWIYFNSSASAIAASKALEISPPSVPTLASEITYSQSPFRVVAPADATLPKNTSWDGVPLYTNLWTGVTPGLIHHNAHRDGLKSLRETVWDRMWYFPHLRTLYDSNLKKPSGPISVVQNEEQEEVWWGPFDEKGGAFTGAMEWVPFNELCDEYDEDFFRDGMKNT